MLTPDYELYINSCNVKYNVKSYIQQLIYGYMQIQELWKHTFQYVQGGYEIKHRFINLQLMIVKESITQVL